MRVFSCLFLFVAADASDSATTTPRGASSGFSSPGGLRIVQFCSVLNNSGVCAVMFWKSVAAVVVALL